MVFTYLTNRSEGIISSTSLNDKHEVKELQSQETQLKETRKFFCITQQLFLFLSQFPSTQRLYFAGFLAAVGKNNFLNFLAIA